MPTLLIVDDERNVLYSLEKAFASGNFDIITAERATEAIDLVARERPSVAILDIRLPDMSGLDAFERIHDIDPQLPVIIVTAYATTESAIEAMKRGVYEYLVKPLDLHELRDVVEKAIYLSHLRRVPTFLPDEGPTDVTADRLIGRCQSMQQIYKDIGRVAPSDVNVLVLGESGTGKELVARAIIQHSARNGAPFLAINCAAIPEHLLESELFGHEQGAFTGADRKRIGKFETANHGAVFLDEIGDMSLATQAKMLRFLQDGSFERIGGNETIRADVRIVAATNQNLDAAIGAGRFREDLFYRLKVFSIWLPPLRERREDIPLLVDYFVKLFNRELNTNITTTTTETMQLIQSYEWPGNVRELQGALKYAFVKAGGNVITPECLPESVRSLRVSVGSGHAPASEQLKLRQYVRRRIDEREPDLYHRIHGEIDRLLLEEALDESQDNQTLASRLLGISRTTLRAKMDGISRTRDVEDTATQ
jgi:nitrogen regulation protein NR(I)